MKQLQVVGKCVMDPVSWVRGTLTINGAFQLNEATSRIYHEILVLPMFFKKEPKKVLILGGGDGCTAAEILKFPEVEEVVIVDWNPKVVELCRTHPDIVKLNAGALDNLKVEVLCGDAYKFCTESTELWDVVVMDFTDTNGTSPIDSERMYQGVRRLVGDDGQWSRVGMLPYRASLPWIAGGGVKILDVAYPRNPDVEADGETFMFCCEEEPYNLEVLSEMKYITNSHLEAFSCIRHEDCYDTEARSMFEDLR